MNKSVLRRESPSFIHHSNNSSSLTYTSPDEPEPAPVSFLSRSVSCLSRAVTHSRKAVASDFRAGRMAGSAIKSTLSAAVHAVMEHYLLTICCRGTERTVRLCCRSRGKLGLSVCPGLECLQGCFQMVSGKGCVGLVHEELERVACGCLAG